MESDTHKDTSPPAAENRATQAGRRPTPPEAGGALNLQPLAASCFVTHKRFEEGDRVVSFLVRLPSFEVRRFDVIASSADGFAPEGILACRWVHVFKPRAREGDADRELKLTAENLFLTLADPMTEQAPETVRLLQFLALMLERKRVLRPRGLNADGTRNILEHAKTKQLFEVRAGDLTPGFFASIQNQLTVLVGEPRAERANVPPKSAPGSRGIEDAPSPGGR
jgi:hypothetical protein